MAKVESARPAFELDGHAVPAGRRATVDLPVARLYTHAQLTMPVHVIHGGEDGPCLFVCAAIHGDEINGVEIIRRLIRQRALRRLKGTLLAVPVVNVHGFLNRSRYLPDRRDLNRSFPGTGEGSMTAQLARLFLDQVASRCTHGIDLHTGSNYRTNLPQVRAQLDDPETERLARAFGAPVLLDSALRDGSLRAAAEKLGATVLVYEGGEALRFSEWAVRVGLRGVLSVLRALGMLPPSARAVPTRTFLSRKTSWARAPQSGILRARKKPGARVKRGEVLGTVADPFGENEMEVRAHVAGIIVGGTTLPLVHQGEALFLIGQFQDPERVAATIETLRQDHDAEPEFV